MIKTVLSYVFECRIILFFYILPWYISFTEFNSLRYVASRKYGGWSLKKLMAIYEKVDERYYLLFAKTIFRIIDLT